jgi:hypothetical protein
MSDERIVASGDAAAVKRESARRTRRSFLAGGVAAAAGYSVARMIANSPYDGRLQSALRKTLDFDAAVNRAVFAERGLAPTYPVSHAKPLRLNGVIGLEDSLPVEGWRLQIAGVTNAKNSPFYVPDVTAWEYKYAAAVEPSEADHDLKKAPGNGSVSKTGKVTELNPEGAVDSDAGAALAAHIEALTRAMSKKRHEGGAEAGASKNALDIGTAGLLLTMEELMKLPHVELVTEFKCIEGWSNVTQWGGVRLRDFIDAYPPEKVNGRNPRYVYMETPNGDYYCGYDMKAARHPQSLLVTEMGGQPLLQEHGAPLRLHMPIKYGYKQIKRIGLIAYTDQKPDDYWTKLGYDWYAGL